VPCWSVKWPQLWQRCVYQLWFLCTTCENGVTTPKWLSIVSTSMWQHQQTMSLPPPVVDDQSKNLLVVKMMSPQGAQSVTAWIHDECLYAMTLMALDYMTRHRVPWAPRDRPTCTYLLLSQLHMGLIKTTAQHDWCLKDNTNGPKQPENQQHRHHSWHSSVR